MEWKLKIKIRRHTFVALDFGRKRRSRLRQGFLALRTRRACTPMRICPGVTFGNEQRVPREKNKCTSEKSGEVVRRVVNDLSHGQKSKRYSQGKIDQTTPRLRRRKSRRGRKILKSR
jgi:hypothetical protein